MCYKIKVLRNTIMNTDKGIYKIINSDCLDVFKKMPNESVDLIVTDPPIAV